MQTTPTKNEHPALALDLDALLAEPYAKTPTLPIRGEDLSLGYTPYKHATSPGCAATVTPASTWAPTPSDSVFTPTDGRWTPESLGRDLACQGSALPLALAQHTPQERMQVYTQLQQCAESYALTKKAHQGEALLEALRGLYVSTATSLGEEAEVPEDPDLALRELVGKFVPEFGGEATSVGSIPTVLGRERDARPCRFFPKGKCFDGVLCRFSHAPEIRSALHNITNDLCKLSPSKPGASPTRRGSRGAGSARRKKESRTDPDKQLWNLLGLGPTTQSTGYSLSAMSERKRLDSRPDKLAALFDALKATGGVDPSPRHGYPMNMSAASQPPNPQAAQEYWAAYTQAYNDAATAHANALIAGLTPTVP